MTDIKLTDAEVYEIEQRRKSTREHHDKARCPKCGAKAYLSHGHSRSTWVCTDRENCGWNDWGQKND